MRLSDVSTTTILLNSIVLLLWWLVEVVQTGKAIMLCSVCVL